MDTRTALQNGFRLQLHSRNNGTLTLYISKELGRGGSCIVYEAYYLASNNDRKFVRIKECYPTGLEIGRSQDGQLLVPEKSFPRFQEARERMIEDFHTLTELYYRESAYDSFVSSPEFYTACGTIYSLLSFGSETTLADNQPESLQGCIGIVAKTAKAIQILHKAGYLYLDCKPENILYIHGQTERVQLFDLNSLIQMDTLRSAYRTPSERISFTPEYAAPELALGKISHIGPWTDVYSIGALLFWLLFHHAPETKDGLSDAIYSFQNMIFLKSAPSSRTAQKSDLQTQNNDLPWSEILLRKLTQFFHETLAPYYGNRMSDMTAVIRALEEMEPIADEKVPFLRSCHVDAPDIFLGREKELHDLDVWLSDSAHSVTWITGAGGMGKTALVQSFANRHRKDIDNLVFLSVSSTIDDAIADDWQVRIVNVSRASTETIHEYAMRKLFLLQKTVEECDGISLLAVDCLSSDTIPQKALSFLAQAGWRIILISHGRPFAYTGMVLELKGLDPASGKKLLLCSMKWAPDRIAEQKDGIDTIVRYAGGNPFLIKLMANQLHEERMTVETVASLMRGDGNGFSSFCPNDGLVSSLKRILHAENLSAEETLLLHLLRLFSSSGIDVHLLQMLSNLSFEEQLSSLLHDGWIRFQNGRVFLTSLCYPIIDSIALSNQDITVINTLLRSLEKALTFSDVNLSLPQEFLPVLRSHSGALRSEPEGTDLPEADTSEVFSCSLHALEALRGNKLSSASAYRDLLFHSILLLPTGEEERIRDLSLMFLKGTSTGLYAWQNAAVGYSDYSTGAYICGIPSILADLFVIDYAVAACFAIGDEKTASWMADLVRPVLQNSFRMPEGPSVTWTAYTKAFACYTLSGIDDELLGGDYAPVNPDHARIRQHMSSFNELGITNAEKSKKLDGGRMLAVNLCTAASDILRFYQFPEDRHGFSRIRSSVSLPADRLRVWNLMRQAEKYVGFGKATEKDLQLWVLLNRAWYHTVMDQDFQKTYDCLRQCFSLTDYVQKGTSFVSVMDIDSCIVPVADILRTFHHYDDAISILEKGIALCRGKTGIAPFEKRIRDLDRFISECVAEKDYFIKNTR